MAEKKHEQASPGCPVGSFFEDLEKVFGKKSQFFEHMTRSRLEFMKGLRSLLDSHIESLEKKRSGEPAQKMTNIKVE